MRRLGIAAIVLLALGAGLQAWVRLSPNDPARWDVDPLSAGRPGMENGWLIRPEGGDAVAPVYAMTSEALAQRIDAVARAWPRTRLFAGSVASGRMTYVTRTRFWGFPDFTSVHVFAAGEGASLAAFARARFGRSDFGVNRARLEAWLKRLG